MAYRHRKDIRDRANLERSTNMVTTTTARKSRSYHYNLRANTQIDFDNLIKNNQSKKYRSQLEPLMRSVGQLTPSNVLTINGYFDVKGNGMKALRVRVYKCAKDLNIHVETAFSKDKRALLVRLKRNWPVGVDISLS
jgi:hypothetical protein